MSPLSRLRVLWIVLLLWTGATDAIYAEIEPDGPPEYCTLFHHMVKSAGSTIKDKMYTAFEADSLPPPATCVNGVSWKQECLDSMQNATVIMGYTEMLRHPLQAAGRECETFTMMRHPIDRLVSQFFYCPRDHDVQQRTWKYCGDASDDLTVTERLLEYATKIYRSRAFQQLLFSEYCPPVTFCVQAKPGPPQSVEAEGGWDLLKEVQEILGSYVAVGIVEHWDLSMQLFNAAVKSPVRDWQGSSRSNVGTWSARRDEVYRWAHLSPEIHRALATDMLLYEYAFSVFKNQTRVFLGTVW